MGLPADPTVGFTGPGIIVAPSTVCRILKDAGIDPEFRRDDAGRDSYGRRRRDPGLLHR